MNRRELLAKSGLTVLAVATGCHSKDTTLVNEATAGSSKLICKKTEVDMEGPYYPPHIVERAKLFLEQGQRVVLTGKILKPNCSPQSNAIIQIWHANEFGEYDLSSGERRYTGQQEINEGHYHFDTTLPGAYENGPGVYRPRHFHFKILIDGEERLTTQLYFMGDEYLKYEPQLSDDRKIELMAGPNNILMGKFDFIVG